MKLKNISCDHRWVWIGIDHTFGTDGFVDETIFVLKCKKCGELFRVKDITSYEYEFGLNQTNNELPEYWRNILK